MNHNDLLRPAGDTNIAVFKQPALLFIYTNITISYSPQLNIALHIFKRATLCLKNPKPQPSF